MTMLSWVREDWHETGYKCMRARAQEFLYFDVWQSERGASWNVAINECTVAQVKDVQEGVDLAERLLGVLSGSALVSKGELLALQEEIERELSPVRSEEDIHYNSAFISGMRVLGDRVMEKCGTKINPVQGEEAVR